MSESITNFLATFATADTQGQVYTVGGALCVAGWLPLLIAPYSSLSHKIVWLSSILTALIYLPLIASTVVDYGGPIALQKEITSLEGMMRLWKFALGHLPTPNLFMYHYFAMDLQYGLVVARDAKKRGYSQLTILPVLLLSALATPIGFVAWNLMTAILG